MSYWIAIPSVGKHRMLMPHDYSVNMWELTKLFREGLSLIDAWVPVSVRYYPGDEQFEGDVEREQSLPVGEFPNFLARGVPVFTGRALRVLHPLIENSVEILPLESSEGEFYIINVAIVDCLNLEHSEYETFPSGTVTQIQKYVFTTGCIGNRHIFRLPQLSLGEVYVSDEFRRLVEGHDLHGLEFHRIPCQGTSVA